jgi:hypothetical protein
MQCPRIQDLCWPISRYAQHVTRALGRPQERRYGRDVRRVLQRQEWYRPALRICLYRTYQRAL